MTDYEKAMLLFACAQNEYMNIIIAWANRNGKTNGDRIERVAEALGGGLVKLPEVVKFLRDNAPR